MTMSPSQRTAKAQSLPNVPNVFNRSPKRASTPEMSIGYPRPIALASFHALQENWQMTDELMAEIERADYAQAQGTSGVAYAGGAQSGPVYVREAPSPARPPPEPRNRPLPASPASSPPHPDRLSPSYHTPQGSSGEDHVRRDTPKSPTSKTPPLHAMKTRTPDKSLPVQEEPEDELTKDVDDDDTLIETETVYRDPDRDRESYTPRSPSASLPPHNRIPKHHRNGSTDQLGLHSVDTIVNPKPSSPNSRPHPLQTQLHREDHYYDDPASAYLQMYFQSTRPNAPIPPTPHSQTAAPSPSPFVSSIQPSPAPPVGSPYPYPFTHVHRNAYAHTVPTAPSSAYDPNHPSVIEEQLALQMQMYALNNNAAPMSDSTFSPSTTPFPGAGYNPWAFLQASRAFGGRRFDSMSLQSSPSHQPVSLPSRSRAIKKREKSLNLKTSQMAVKPPPRVESTQPRDTSPEPYSSGEETAGEGFEVHEEPAWVNGDADDGDWVDEEGDRDELLDLEYHPSFVSHVDKRRRKWDTRWEALHQAFQALDCETDTTMILLASPSHSTKLHALTSRSVRRDQLLKSPAMSQIRTAFKGIASRRHANRSRTFTASILSRLANASTDEAREVETKRALEAALGSLESLRAIYEGRVSRWEEEMARISDERERVELLLRQTIGMGLQPNGQV